MCVGGGRMDCPGSTSAKTVDPMTVKILLNSVTSTPNAKFMTGNIKDFCLNNNLDRCEHIRILVGIVPTAIMQQCDLAGKVVDGHVHAEVHKGMHGSPQAGKIMDDVLVEHLSQCRHKPCKFTLGLFEHETRPIAFSLVVDDFGVQHAG